MFFELIQITIGNKDGFDKAPSDKEWIQLYNLSCTQSLASVALEGVNRIIERDSSQKPPMGLLYEWIGIQQQTIAQNKLQNQRAKELCELFKEHGYRSCVLKGQGTALYYDHPNYRQCGDIDVWVDGVRDDILRFAKSKNYHVGHIDIKHSDIDFFEDVPVEVHFLPSWMYNPSTNKKLQKFFEEQSEKQFDNKDATVGFTHTTIEFDLVFSIVLIYRHIFSEGIGLRQLMDYYFILQSSSVNQRRDAFAVLGSLKMLSFVGGIMWILKECFGMKEEYLLCVVNKRHGEYLLSEIMTAGNFGQYDDRMLRIDKNKKFKRGFVQLKRNLRFVSYYPSEVLWSPFWKLWHWGWRKRKGYL
jgi:hypothetical protein